MLPMAKVKSIISDFSLGIASETIPHPVIGLNLGMRSTAAIFAFFTPDRGLQLSISPLGKINLPIK